MIIKTIDGFGHKIQDIEGDVFIKDCTVVIEGITADQLRKITMINSIIKLKEETIYTDNVGEHAHKTK